MPHAPTLRQFLAAENHLYGNPESSLIDLILETTLACKVISHAVNRGALAGVLGSATSDNVQGERQKKLDIIANDVMIDTLLPSGMVAGLASEEMEDAVPVPEGGKRGNYLVLFDPLDGSSNIDVNISVGTIFSILPYDQTHPPGNEDFLQPGTRQLGAGFVLYGPATVLVLTTGNGTHSFTLDPDIGEFILTRQSITIPEETSEFAINASNHRHWEPPVRRHIEECLQGVEGPRGRNFNMRWVASMVADVYRVLSRGGIFMYPRDTRDPAKPGKLRLMYEANPMSLLVEQAGGAAGTGYEPIMAIQPEGLHQRVPVILGSRQEVEQVTSYHGHAVTGR